MQIIKTEEKRQKKKKPGDRETEKTLEGTKIKPWGTDRSWLTVRKSGIYTNIFKIVM